MFGVEQTQMVGGVSRGMNSYPFTTGKTEMFGISQADSRSRQAHELRNSTSHRDTRPTLKGDIHSGSAPRWRFPRHAMLRRVVRVVNVDIGWFGWIPKDAKLFVRDDVATSFGP